MSDNKKRSVVIRQPFYLKYIAAAKKLARKVSFIKNEQRLDRVVDTWYGLEQANDAPFRWSHPIAKLSIKNLDMVVITASDPLGREITIMTKEVNHTVKLVPGELYEFVISTYDAEELWIRTDPFNPENDTRSLGLQYFHIATKQCVILN
jgi:hypothetical protein